MGLFGNSMGLDIRPLEDNQKFEAFTVLQEHTLIVSYEPHMHAAGVRMCLDAIWGQTTRIETLSCVGYDHSWVRTYNFADDAAPLLPKGTILRLTGYFNRNHEEELDLPVGPANFLEPGAPDQGQRTASGLCALPSTAQGRTCCAALRTTAAS